jgi:hypothetical protein
MRLASFLTAAALTAAATSGWAGTMDASGTGHGSSMATPMPVAEGVVMINAQTMYERFDGAGPLSTAKGPCFGTVLINKGAVSGQGLCHYTVEGGDVAMIEWVAGGVTPDGRTTGTWTVLGGSGAWDGATGGGTFNAGTDAAGAYTNTVTGEITMP